MTVSSRITTAITLSHCMLWSAIGLAQPASPITIVLADNAPALEKLAAEELQGQIDKLWGRRANIIAKSPAGGGSEMAILIGSPATNPSVQALVGDRWPALSDQGIVIRTVDSKGGAQLVVGGGSPVATLWAVYELGHQWGIRYQLHGDAYPAEAPKFHIEGWNIAQEPNLRSRCWRTINDFPIGPESWGLAEHQRMLRQLAKQKFNRVLLSVYPWQPFSHFEFGGVKKQSAMLWFGYRYPIDGDVPGRSIFKGAREFYNPDLAGKKTYEERTQAGMQLVRGIIDESHRLGMTVGLAFSPLEFPKEFAAALPEAKVIRQLENLTVGPGAKQAPDNALLAELATAQLRSYLTAYPTLDAIYLTLPEFPEWDEHTESAWNRLSARTGLGKTVSLKDLEQAAAKRTTLISGERGVKAVRGNVTSLDFLQTWLSDPKRLQRPDGTSVELYLIEVDPVFYPYLDKLLPKDAGSMHLVDYTARRVAANTELMKTLPGTKRPRPLVADPSLIFTLADDNVGVLPQLATRHLEKLAKSLRSSGWAGYSTRYWIAGDLDPTVHYLSRVAFDDSVTPEQAYEDLLRPNAGGGGISERSIIGWNQIEKATDLIDQHDIGFAFPVPNMVMKHYAATEPAPAWWQEVSDLYLNAMNEMYRAHDAADPSGRRLLYTLARRYEFALEYMTAMQAVRAAGVARANRDSKTQLAKLEAAAEGLYNGLNALSTVSAEDSSYKGVIAVVTEYGYRPLQKEIARLQDEMETPP
ncbi:MAG: hypothetical protein FJ295_16320 [Planctomycetes bacterium]|nr:hypothetical protein [Planctomycetota bacterium]